MIFALARDQRTVTKFLSRKLQKKDSPSRAGLESLILKTDKEFSTILFLGFDEVYLTPREFIFVNQITF